MYTTFIHKNDHDVDALASTWLRLTNRCSEVTVFQSYYWLIAWYKEQRRHVTPYIVEVKQGGVTVCIFPLCTLVKSKGPIKLKELTWIGYRSSDYLLPIIADGVTTSDVLQQAFDAIVKDKRSWDYINLEDIPQGSTLDTYLQQVSMEGLSVSKGTYRTPCPFLSLNSEWEQIENRLGPTLMKDIRRKEGYLNKIGSVKFEIVTKAEQIVPTMQVLLELHGKRWATTSTPSQYQDLNSQNQLINLAAALWKAGTLHLSYLSINNRAISVHFGMSDGHRLYYYIPAYDPSFHKGSPGKVLIYHLIKDCHHRGYMMFDFMRGDESYKKDWATVDNFNNKWVLFNKSIKSKLYFMYSKKLDKIV